MSRIEDKYNALLAQGWTLAIPTPVIGLPVPGTAGQFFSYILTTGVAVTIYDHPDTGAFEVHGAILDRHLAIGGPLAFGFAISDEIDDVVGGQVVGRVSHFQRGSIFFSNGQVSEMTVSTPSVPEFEIVAGIDDERPSAELRERQRSPAGRAKLRERAAVEHALAHLGRWQGARARYRGKRKNLFDLRRCAVIHNLHVIARLPEPPPAPASQAEAA